MESPGRTASIEFLRGDGLSLRHRVSIIGAFGNGGDVPPGQRPFHRGTSWAYNRAGEDGQQLHRAAGGGGWKPGISSDIEDAVRKPNPPIGG